MNTETILILLGSLLLAQVAWSHLRLSLSLGRKKTSGRLAAYPPVTVIRPVKGLDAGARQNIEAALDTGYPGEVETLFVFDDENEPALPLVRSAIDARRLTGRPVAAKIVFSGPPPAGRTGKLNAMIAGLEKASGELVAFADSDIRPDRDALRVLVETLLGAEKAGSAFAPVVVSEPTRTVGDAGYALLLNGLYGPAAAWVADRNGGQQSFIMGQFMVFTREAFTAICGLESAEGQLVDDMYLGARVTASGLRNLVSPHAVPIIQQDLPYDEFVRTYKRWITFSRTGLPSFAFKLSSWIRGTVFWLGLVGALAALAGGWWLAAAIFFLAPLATSASINALHSRMGGTPLPMRRAWVSFWLLLIAPVIFFRVLAAREVNWRGRSYRLDAGSRLQEGSAQPADRVCVDYTLRNNT